MIHNSNTRNGNFTSSKIAALLSKSKDGKGFGKPALTYIEEKNFERKLGRSLSCESNAKPLTWGKFLESRCFDLLGLEYSLCSQDTLQHPEISYWSGSPDGVKKDTVIDIKCPLTLKAFCTLADCKTIEEVRENAAEGETYYWQLVSNAILTNSKFAELIVYCPYKSELQDINLMAQESGKSEYMWISYATENDLPWLNDNGYYKNLNTIRFEVSEEDKQLLTDKVIAAGKELIPNVIMAHHDQQLNTTIIQNG